MKIAMTFDVDRDALIGIVCSRISNDERNTKTLIMKNLKEKISSDGADFAEDFLNRPEDYDRETQVAAANVVTKLFPKVK